MGPSSSAAAALLTPLKPCPFMLRIAVRLLHGHAFSCRTKQTIGVVQLTPPWPEDEQCSEGARRGRTARWRLEPKWFSRRARPCREVMSPNGFSVIPSLEALVQTSLVSTGRVEEAVGAIG